MFLPDRPADNPRPRLRGRPRLCVSPPRRGESVPDRLDRPAGPEQRADGREQAGRLHPAVWRVRGRPGGVQSLRAAQAALPSAAADQGARRVPDGGVLSQPREVPGQLGGSNQIQSVG